ncbi:ribosomal protein S5 domain 2-like superfamily protein [Artemisia annua]|uniref:Ribosomal protein S5 domain 2-like superfamily protein n=1 Tax=Artemisia annua TaxID=35608 RepID=A0A2U1MYB3_ARTAN|nr:ribosomal protein S5 domain 2-like superfamily protein [Artemisia annua]
MTVRAKTAESKRTDDRQELLSRSFDTWKKAVKNMIYKTRELTASLVKELPWQTQVQDPRATHNCWAYKVGNQYRSKDDGEVSGTAGKPIISAIANSGLDRVMVVVIRHYGGIKLGTGGLVRAYGGLATECLKSAPTRLIKSQVPMGVEVSFDLLGVFYRQLQSFKAEDIKQDYDTGKDGITMVTFKISFDQAAALEEALKTNCSRNLVFYKH